MDISPSTERRLIVNADDFGLTEGVNHAILELNDADVLPSATLMATGLAFRDAAHAAFKQTSLGVGCHVVLVDGQPELDPAELPTLAPEGRLRSNLTTFIVDLFGGRIASQEIEREAIAQIRQVQSAGITVTHIDTHKHTHMFPRVLGPLIRAARACDVSAIRNPFEPDWSLRLTEKAPRTRPCRSAHSGSSANSFCGLCALPGCARQMALWACLLPGHLTQPTCCACCTTCLPAPGRSSAIRDTSMLRCIAPEPAS